MTAVHRLDLRATSSREVAPVCSSRLFWRLDNLREDRRVLRRDVRENFAVQSNLGGLQTLHEAAVGQTRFANGGGDADLPQVAERALAHLAVAVGVLPSVVNGIGKRTVKFRAAQPEAFGTRIILVRRLREAGALVTRMVC